jgi:hypothetical protein
MITAVTVPGRWYRRWWAAAGAIVLADLVAVRVGIADQLSTDSTSG